MLGERRQAQGRVGWGTGWGAGSPALAGPSVWGRLGLAELAAAPAHQVSPLLSLEPPALRPPRPPWPPWQEARRPSPQQPGSLRGQGTELCGQRIMEAPHSAQEGLGPGASGPGTPAVVGTPPSTGTGRVFRETQQKPPLAVQHHEPHTLCVVSLGSRVAL